MAVRGRRTGPRTGGQRTSAPARAGSCRAAPGQAAGSGPTGGAGAATMASRRAWMRARDRRRTVTARWAARAAAMAPASESAASTAASGARAAAGDQRGGVQRASRRIARAADHPRHPPSRASWPSGPSRRRRRGSPSRTTPAGSLTTSTTSSRTSGVPVGVDASPGWRSAASSIAGPSSTTARRRGAVVQAEGVRLDGRHEPPTRTIVPNRVARSARLTSAPGGVRIAAAEDEPSRPRGGRAGRRPARGPRGPRTRPHWTCPARGRAPSAARPRTAGPSPSGTVA